MYIHIHMHMYMHTHMRMHTHTHTRTHMYRGVEDCLFGSTCGSVALGRSAGGLGPGLTVLTRDPECGAAVE
jgi:hypothetical protein